MRATPQKGLLAGELARRLHVEDQQLAPVLQALAALDWVGAVQPPGLASSIDGPQPRYVLLVEPGLTPLQPLLEALLLMPTPAMEPLWRRAQLARMNLQDLL